MASGRPPPLRTSRGPARPAPRLGVVLPSRCRRPAGPRGARRRDRQLRHRLRRPARAALRVTETIVYRFGTLRPARHQPDLITREKYDDNHDAVYAIDEHQGQEPDPGVADAVDAPTTERRRPTEVMTRSGSATPTDRSRRPRPPTSSPTTSPVRCGPSRTSSPRTTSSSGTPPGSTGRRRSSKVAITATVPGGAQELNCFAGPVGSTTHVRQRRSPAASATFTQTDLAAGRACRSAIKIEPGLVTDNAPHLEPDGSKLLGEREDRLWPWSGDRRGHHHRFAAGRLRFWWRKNGRDQRYAGLAPGMRPLAGQEAPDRRRTIPTCRSRWPFSPPRIPVAEAGLLIDGQVDPRETAATIIDLAVRGALGSRARARTISRSP